MHGLREMSMDEMQAANMVDAATRFKELVDQNAEIEAIIDERGGYGWRDLNLSIVDIIRGGNDETGNGLFAEYQYHKDAMRTAAGPEVFYPSDQCTVQDLATALTTYIAAARRIDQIKAMLFYGKDRPLPEPNKFDLDCLDYRRVANPQMIHAILGIASEGGELAENLLEGLCGQEPDEDNMVRESGDIDWFQELLAKVLSTPVSEARRRNITRLRERFPDKFSEADALARADEESDAKHQALDVASIT